MEREIVERQWKKEEGEKPPKNYGKETNKGEMFKELMAGMGS